ncbi:MAG: hypothetical protein KC420_12215, partial [Myxococcales bacterium]|nr:hypothetical protein [Myxococcales bacterium]
MSDQPIVDELDRPIDVERTLDQAPPRDPDAGAPPSLADLPQGLWPLHLATHPRLLSAAGRSERSQRLADYLLAESGHRSGPLKSILAGEAGRILIQELGQQFQGQAII